MKKVLTLAVISIALLGVNQAKARIIADSPYVEIWTDRGEGAIYHPGEWAEVCIRPAQNCYVIVYEIDSDGYLRLLFPADCYGDGFVRAGQIYRIGRGAHRRFYVNGPSGIAYVHVLASYQPFRTLYWNGCRGYEAYGYEVTWGTFNDYWGCALPPRIYGDPYIAMETIDEFICPDLIEAGVIWADFTYFYVDSRVPYPRYVCYDCHGFNPRIRPYSSVCLGFSITFVECDPCCHPWSWWWWCSPKRVYCGPRYVCYARKPCRDYPSVYKWKSRMESSFGDGVVRDYKNRGRGNPRGAKGVKDYKKVRRLYSRSEPRGKKKSYETRVIKKTRSPIDEVSLERKARRSKVNRHISEIAPRGMKIRSKPSRKKGSTSGLSILKRLVSGRSSKSRGHHSVLRIKGKSHSSSTRSKRRRLSR